MAIDKGVETDSQTYFCNSRDVLFRGMDFLLHSLYFIDHVGLLCGFCGDKWSPLASDQPPFIVPTIPRAASIASKKVVRALLVSLIDASKRATTEPMDS